MEFYVSFLLRVGYGFFGVKRPVAWSGRDSRLRRVKRWRSVECAFCSWRVHFGVKKIENRRSYCWRSALLELVCEVEVVVRESVAG